MPTRHCHDWKSEKLVTADGVKTVCNLRRPALSLARTPQVINCDTCALRVLREGQDIGLSIDEISRWTWEDLKATPHPQVSHECAG